MNTILNNNELLLAQFHDSIFNRLKDMSYIITETYEYVINYLKSSFIEKDRDYHKITPCIKLAELLEKTDVEDIFSNINNFNEILLKNIKKNLNIKDRSKLNIAEDYVKKSILKLVYYDYLNQKEGIKNKVKIEYLVTSICNNKDFLALKNKLNESLSDLEDFGKKYFACGCTRFYESFRLKDKLYQPIGKTYVDKLVYLNNILNSFSNKLEKLSNELIEKLKNNDVDIEYFKIYKQIYLYDKTLLPLKIYVNNKLSEVNTYRSDALLANGLLYASENFKYFNENLKNNFLKYENKEILENKNYKKAIEKLLLTSLKTEKTSKVINIKNYKN